MKKLCLSILFSVIFISNSVAWIYPEHRKITLHAIEQLDSLQLSTLNWLWQQARKGNESRLDSLVGNSKQGLKPSHLDFAAWPAIGGDHSVSPQNMLEIILHSKWILNVADIAEKLNIGIEKAKTKSDIENELRNSDLRLLRADPEYVSRAGSNHVHFLIARPSLNITSIDYFDFCNRTSTDINLAGVYNFFHSSALKKAQLLQISKSLTQEQLTAISLAVLADEAFAIHFIEDAFSAGHVAGIWGDASQRKGTHDFYDENGLEVSNWKKERYILTGDAYMINSNAVLVAKTIKKSLIQVLDMISGHLKLKSDTGIIDSIIQPSNFNIAKAIKMPRPDSIKEINDLSVSILTNTPVPCLESGIGEMPRFRSEIGPFIGITPAISLSEIANGFSSFQNKKGVIPGIEFAIHIGLGTDGILNKASDGLVFLDFGWKIDKSSSVKIKGDNPDYLHFGSILAAVPSRETFYLRLRMPFYVVPGDLIVASPFLLLISPKILNKMIATASEGGFIPIQSGLMTPIGRFQFMLGREVGISFYNSFDNNDRFLFIDPVSSNLVLVAINTTKVEFPIVEYRPIRSFSQKQSANMFVQLNAGIDIPTVVRNISAVTVNPSSYIRPIWFVGIRLGFDWRYYLSKN